MPYFQERGTLISRLVAGAAVLLLMAGGLRVEAEAMAHLDGWYCLDLVGQPAP